MASVEEAVFPATVSPPAVEGFASTMMVLVLVAVRPDWSVATQLRKAGIAALTALAAATRARRHPSRVPPPARCPGGAGVAGGTGSRLARGGAKKAVNAAPL